MMMPAAEYRGYAHDATVRRTLPSRSRMARSRPSTSSLARVTRHEGWKYPFGVGTKSAGTPAGRDPARRASGGCSAACTLLPASAIAEPSKEAAPESVAEPETSPGSGLPWHASPPAARVVRSNTLCQTPSRTTIGAASLRAQPYTPARGLRIRRCRPLRLLDREVVRVGAGRGDGDGAAALDRLELGLREGHGMRVTIGERGGVGHAGRGGSHQVGGQHAERMLVIVRHGRQLEHARTGRGVVVRQE